MLQYVPAQTFLKLAQHNCTCYCQSRYLSCTHFGKPASHQHSSSSPCRPLRLIELGRSPPPPPLAVPLEGGPVLRMRASGSPVGEKCTPPSVALAPAAAAAASTRMSSGDGRSG